MRRFIATAAVLLLAACATTPATEPLAPTVPVATKPQRGGLIGSSASELVSRFGQPRIQVREGEGTKLQFVTARCILDAYLYPVGGGTGGAKVTHIDTRTRDGRDTSQTDCITAIETR